VTTFRVALSGDFVNPEDKAYGRRDGAPIALYRVRLRQSDLWPGYTGPPDDVLEIEIYDHWLAPAGAVRRAGRR